MNTSPSICIIWKPLSMCRCCRNERGLSLVELMVAVALSTIIILALAELYVNMARSNEELAKTNSQIESARFAMQLLQDDIVHAGYWGGFVPEFDDLTWADTPSDTPSLVPDPCLSLPWNDAARIDALIGIPLESRSGVPTECSGILPNKLANTDVLVVRRLANETSNPVTECDPAGAVAPVCFQVSNCQVELDANNTYAFVAPDSYILNERDCAATIALPRRFLQSIYYIRDYGRIPGDGIPTLMRSEFGIPASGTPATARQLAAEPVVEGIERFRIELGIDNESAAGLAVDYLAPIVWADLDVRNSPTNRGDGTADVFVHCGAGCNVAQLTNVVEVRVHILSRAAQPTMGFIDNKTYSLGGLTVDGTTLTANFKRHVFSSNIRLYNVSGRRETPLPTPVAP